MRLIDLGPVEALRALALEEAVLEAVDSGGGEPAWLFWTAPRLSAVLGTARAPIALYVSMCTGFCMTRNFKPFMSSGVLIIRLELWMYRAPMSV